MTPVTAHPFPTVDADNPWPGLAAFTEDQRGFFFGREKETEELVRLIRRQTLTVLFGQSGLGKSSLLQAGVFPRLREHDYLPLYLRLDHSSDSPPLADQVRTALTAAFDASGAEAPEFRTGETLWEYFHRKDVDIWSAKNHLLTPVLAFDQFEEIFTLGRADDTRRARGAAFLSELADLVENRAPSTVRARFDAGELDPSRYNFDKPSCQVVLTLREDFLPDLEGLKTEMRSILTNRMRIRRLTGAQALEIVTKPAPHLLAEGVAERVVEFVAGARGGSVERLLELEVEPALLSVICRELNERRRALGQVQVTTDLVTGNRREILTDFYERCVADLPPAMRAFVEDRLLTKSGFRDNFALETALETPGVSRELIDTLVSRRLLRIEEHLGVPRVELAHDVLAEVVRASRDTRQQRVALKEARRHTLMLQGLAAGLVLLLAGASWIAWRAVQARKAEATRSSRADFAAGSQKLAQGNFAEGLAHLVRAGTTDPENPLVATRLMAEVAFRNFALPKGEPLEHPEKVETARFLPDGRRCLVRAAGILHMWDLESGKLIRTLDTSAKVTYEEWSRDGRLVAVGDAEGALQIWDLEAGKRLMGPLRHEQKLWYPKFSPDGRWLCTRGTDDVARIWDVTTGEPKGSMKITGRLRVLDFSPDSQRLLTWSRDGSWRIWSVPGGEPVTPEVKTTPVTAYNGSSAFHPSGRWVAIADSWTSMRFSDATTGAGVGARMEHPFRIHWSAFSGDGKLFATVSLDQTAQLWEVPSGKPVGAPLDHGEPLTGVMFTADGRRLITWSSVHRTRIWDLATRQLVVDPIPFDVLWTTIGPDGGEFAVGDGRRLFRWDARPRALAPLYYPPFAESYAVQPSEDGKAWRFDRYQLQEIELLSNRPTGISKFFPVPVGKVNQISPDASFLATATFASDVTNVELWDLRSGNIVRRKIDAVTPPLFSQDSKWCREPRGKALRFWNTATGERVGKDMTLGAGLNGWDISRDGGMVAVGTAGSGLELWDLQAGNRLGEPLREAGGALLKVALSPDGKFVAAGGFETTVQIWEIATRRPASPLLQHRHEIRQVQFTRDGRRLMTRDYWQMRIWDVATGTEVIEPITQPYATKEIFLWAVFNEDESWIATWTVKGEVRVWDSASGLLVAGPIRTKEPIARLAFLDSSRILFASHANGAYSICPVPPRAKDGRVPAWLLQLAGTMAGGTFDRASNFQPRTVAAEQYVALRRELNSAPSGDALAEWGRWFFSDPDQRPVGPGMKHTIQSAGELAWAPKLAEWAERIRLLRKAGQTTEALADARRVLDYVVLKAGEANPHAADWQTILVEALLQLGQFSEAEPLARKALATRERQFDADSHFVGYARGNLGHALAGLSRPAEAKPLLLAACVILWSRYEGGNFGLELTDQIARFASALVPLLTTAGESKLAEEWKTRTSPESIVRTSVAVISPQLKDNRRMAARFFRLMALQLLDNGEFEQALSWAKRSLDYRLNVQTQDSVFVAQARSSMGLALQGLKRYQEAEAVLIEVWEMQKTAIARGTVAPRDVSFCREGVAALVKIYEATGRPEKAEEWKKILATIPDYASPTYGR